MAEYINKEAVRDALYEADAILMSGLKILNQFPAADVAPVRHGRWIGKNSPYDVNIHICSVCRGQVSILGNKLRFCPYCGARMDGGDKNDE